jgi:hypothetical protein
MTQIGQIPLLSGLAIYGALGWYLLGTTQLPTRIVGMPASTPFDSHSDFVASTVPSRAPAAKDHQCISSLDA